MRPFPATFARLLREPRRFGFDAAARVLQHAAGTPDLADAARFRSVPSLAYAAAEVESVRQEGAGAPRVATTVMGLTGAAGVLPRHYTEILIATLRDRSRALHDFNDLLSHRMVARFAQAATKYRLHRAADHAMLARRQAAADPQRAAAARDPDQITTVLLALGGHGTAHLAPRVLVGVDPLLHYAGAFAMRPRSADRLAALVSDWLGRTVEVEQFAGAWLPLPPDQRTAMPRGRRPGQWNRLGVDAAIGVRAWDVQGRIILRVGPLDAASFAAMLPDRPALRRLVSLVRTYLGAETGFAVNLVLAAADVPATRMHPAADPPPRLGWNCWLPMAGRRGRDAAEALFEAETVEASIGMSTVRKQERA